MDTRLKVVSIIAGGEGTLAGDLRAVFRFQSFQLWSLCLAGMEQERLKSSMPKNSQFATCRAALVRPGVAL